jgi:hypothetical protein
MDDRFACDLDQTLGKLIFMKLRDAVLARDKDQLFKSE